MQKHLGILLTVILLAASLAFAGGDQNQHRHDGSKGKGKTHQERVNK